MTNVTKILQGLQDNTQVRSNLERAKNKYEDKPFALEHANTYKAIGKVGWLPSLLSVAGASLAFITLMPNMPIYVPILIGGAIAGGYEALKSWATGLGFRAYFKHGSIIAVCLVALLYTGSVAISTYGAFNGYTLLESDKVGSALSMHQSSVDSIDSYYNNLRTAKQAAFTNESDSLDTYYASLISEQTEAIRDYESKHTDKESGDIRWGAHKQHANLVQGLAVLRAERKDVLKANFETSKAELASIEDEHKQALKEVKAKQPNVIQSAKKSMGAYLWLALGVALLIEAVIFVFRWFAEYYDYKSHSQVELLQKGDVLSVDISSIQKLAQLMQLDSSSNVPIQIAETAQQKIVGFKQSSNKTPQSTDIQGLNGGLNYANIDTDKRKYLEKYPHVVTCIQKGLNEKQTLENTKVGRSTYYNVKRIINNL